MSDDVLYSAATLDLLDEFLAEYRRAAHPEHVLERYAAELPELADEFRLQAGFSLIDPIDDPADPPDIKLLREIGRGGMGIVYEGWQESLGRPVAVKLHRMTEAHSERGRFFHECRTLARLHQTSIVPVHTAGRAGPWLYYVMPLIEGASFAELIRRARAQAATGASLPTLPALVTDPQAKAWDLPPSAIVNPGSGYVRSAVEAIVMAAEAIDYAHHEGVWHLDLKPSNMMLDAAGHCWIIDFGTAHRADGEPIERTARGVAETIPLVDGMQPTAAAPFLTMAYAAPERWRGAGDARADVWGLGATLYELLTLRRPFPTDDPASLAAAVAESAPPKATALCGDLPRDLSAIVEKALAKRPDDRYASAGALAADLRRWLGGYETLARSWSRVARWVQAARRHKPWWIAASAVVCALLAALVLLWQKEQSRADEAKARGQTALAEERLLREADSSAKSKVWSLLELARRRAQIPRVGRQADVRRILLEAAVEHRKIAPDETTAFLDVAFRSLYVETLGTFDIAETAQADRASLPNYQFRDWPAAIHPDGDRIALGTAKRPIVFRRGRAKPAPDPADERLPRARVAYGPAGEYLAEMLSEETGGGLRLWDREATRMLGELVAPVKNEPGSIIRAVGFDEKESRLWAARADGRISGWDLPSLAARSDWRLAEKPSGPVTAAAFAPGARSVALGDGAGHVIAFDESGPVVLRTMPRPHKSVDALAWGPFGKRLAAGTGDGAVHVFETNGTFLFRANVSASGVSAIVFSPDGQFVSAHFRDAPGHIGMHHRGASRWPIAGPPGGFRAMARRSPPPSRAMWHFKLRFIPK